MDKISERVTLQNAKWKPEDAAAVAAVGSGPDALASPEMLRLQRSFQELDGLNQAHLKRLRWS